MSCDNSLEKLSQLKNKNQELKTISPSFATGPYQLAQVYFLLLTSPVLLSTYLYTHVLMGRSIYASLFFFTFSMVGAVFASSGIGFGPSMLDKGLVQISKVLLSAAVLSFLMLYALNGPLAILLAREWYFTILFPATGMYGLLSLLNSFLTTHFVDNSEASVTNWLSAVREVRYSMLWPYLFSLTLMTGLLCTTSMKMVMESLFIESAIAQAESNEVQMVPSKTKAISVDGSPMNKAIVGGLTSAGVALICLSSMPFSVPLLAMVAGGSAVIGFGCYGLASSYHISYGSAVCIGAVGGVATSLCVKAAAPGDWQTTAENPTDSPIHFTSSDLTVVKRSIAKHPEIGEQAFTIGPASDKWAGLNEFEISGYTSLVRSLGISKGTVATHTVALRPDGFDYTPTLEEFKSQFDMKDKKAAAAWFGIEKFRLVTDMVNGKEYPHLVATKYLSYLDTLHLQQAYSESAGRVDAPTQEEFRIVTHKILKVPGYFTDEFIFGTRNCTAEVRFAAMQMALYLHRGGNNTVEPGQLLALAATNQKAILGPT